MISKRNKSAQHALCDNKQSTDLKENVAETFPEIGPPVSDYPYIFNLAAVFKVLPDTFLFNTYTQPQPTINASISYHDERQHYNSVKFANKLWKIDAECQYVLNSMMQTTH